MNRRNFLMTAASLPLAGLIPGVAFAAGRSYEVVTHNQPGALLDLMLRNMSEIGRGMDYSLNVQNKSGAKGVAAVSYLMEKKGSSEHLLILPQAHILSLPLTENVPYSFRDLTPLANISLDGMVFAVRADDEATSMAEFIDASKAAAEPKLISVTSVSGTAASLMMDLTDRAGARLEPVVFKSIPECVVGLLNGSVDGVFAQPSMVREHVAAGTLKVLMAATPQRFPAPVDAPTMEELGYGKARVSYRMFFGPPEMPAEAVEAALAMLSQVVNSDAFVAYLASNDMMPHWVQGEALMTMLEEEEALLKAALKK